jgi:hypothetical protein
MKIENKKSPHSAGLAFQPEAQHCWPGLAVQRPSRPTPVSAARALGAVTARWPCAQRRGGVADAASPVA